MDAVEEPCAKLSHWVKHNQKHTAEFADWAERLSGTGKEEIAREIRQAVESMQQATEALKTALAGMNGNDDAIGRTHLDLSPKEKTHEPAPKTASPH